MTLTAPAVGDLITAAYGTEVAGWSQAWTSWSPALTATTTSPTLGTAGTTTGKYLQIGKLIVGWGEVDFGTAATAAGTGTYLLSVPVTGAAIFQRRVTGGDILMKCAGVLTRGWLEWNTSTTVSLVYSSVLIGGARTAAANNLPGAWTANDRLEYTFNYEAA